MADQDDTLAYLKSIDTCLATIRKQLTEVIAYIRDAESEVPEKMRRFIMYFHDVRDMVSMYRETGSDVPPHVMHEIRRCDDRYRQLLLDLHRDGGNFEKVRQEMAKDPDNRYNHTRQLTKGTSNASRQSNNQQNGIDQGRTEAEGGQPSGS